MELIKSDICKLPQRDTLLVAVWQKKHIHYITKSKWVCLQMGSLPTQKK